MNKDSNIDYSYLNVYIHNNTVDITEERGSFSYAVIVNTSKRETKFEHIVCSLNIYRKKSKNRLLSKYPKVKILNTYFFLFFEILQLFRLNLFSRDKFKKL